VTAVKSFNGNGVVGVERVINLWLSQNNVHVISVSITNEGSTFYALVCYESE